MRHLNSGSKLGKQPAHRRAVLRSLVTNLFEHGRITTTLTRAKAARPVAEKMITLGKRDTLQSRRMAASYIMLPAIGRAALARVSVVVIRPCSNKLVTRLRSTARRWAGCFPSLEPELRCRIAYIVPRRLTVRRCLPKPVRRSGLGAAAR